MEKFGHAIRPLRKKPKTLMSFKTSASLQNIDQKKFWSSGDPNTETTPDYDFVWILWILRNIFPKDIITHFVNLVGGCSFTVFRSLPFSPEEEGEIRLSLQFWKYRDCGRWNFFEHRNIYFNIPVHTIKKKKGRIYLFHHQNKIAWIDNP